MASSQQKALVDDVRDALLKIKQRTDGPDPYVDDLYRDAIDSLASLEEQYEDLQRRYRGVLLESDERGERMNELSEQLEAVHEFMRTRTCDGEHTELEVYEAWRDAK